MVSSSGSTTATSSHHKGVDTWPWLRALADQAPNTVLWGAFWLKSTKTRRPRSSFHQFAVTRSGCRRSSSRRAPRLLPGPRRRPSEAPNGRRRAAHDYRWSSGTPGCRARRGGPSRTRLLRGPGRTRRRSGGRGRSAARRSGRGRPRERARRGTPDTPGSRPTRCGPCRRGQVPSTSCRSAWRPRPSGATPERLWARVFRRTNSERAVRKALQHRGPAGCRSQDRIGDGEVVADDIQLGRPETGEVDLAGVRDLDVATRHLDGLDGGSSVWARHADRLTGPARTPVCSKRHPGAPGHAAAR